MSDVQPDIQLDPETFFEQPDVYPMEFDQGRLTLVPMTAETYRSSIFLDRGRIVPAAREGWHLPLGGLVAELERRRPVQQPLRFIFHIAHCGSTLLARALDIPDRTLVLREPFALRQLGAEAAAPDGNAADAQRWRQCLALVGTLLGRRFVDAQPVIVKANVPVNFMLPPLMGLHPDSRGVLLYCSFERYVLSVLKTPMHCRWVGNVTRQLAGGIRATPGLEGVVVDRLPVAEAAACLWVAQMRRLKSLSERTGAVTGLDCETFFERPIEVLDAVTAHFGIDIPTSVFQASADEGLYDRHGKDPGRPYDRQSRERELDELRRRLDAELAAAMNWLDASGIDEASLRPHANIEP